MAKIVYFLAFLAVCQYAAAAAAASQDNTAAAVAIIKDNVPGVVVNVISGIENFVKALPSAEQIDKMVAEGMKAVEEIIEQLGAAGNVAQKIREYAPVIIRKVINASVETVVKTISENLQSARAQEIAQLITGVMNGMSSGVMRVAGVANEAIECVEHVVAAQPE